MFELWVEFSNPTRSNKIIELIEKTKVEIVEIKLTESELQTIPTNIENPVNLTFEKTFEGLYADEFFKSRVNLIKGNSFFRGSKKDFVRSKDFNSHYENGTKKEEQKKDPNFRAVSMFLKNEDIKKSLGFLFEKMVTSPALFTFVLQVRIEDKAGIVTDLDEDFYFHVNFFKSDRYEISDIIFEENYDHDRIKDIFS